MKLKVNCIILKLIFSISTAQNIILFAFNFKFVDWSFKRFAKNSFTRKKKLIQETKGGHKK